MKAKQYLMFKCFKCDLTLEKEEDNEFLEQFNEFNELFFKFSKGNNCLLYILDIIEMFIHIFEFNVLKAVHLDKLINSIYKSLNYNKLEQEQDNYLINYVLGLLCSKLNNKRVTAMKFLSKSYKKIKELQVKDVSLTYIKIVKIRIMENIFYLID